MLAFVGQMADGIVAGTVLGVVFTILEGVYWVLVQVLEFISSAFLSALCINID